MLFFKTQFGFVNANNLSQIRDQFSKTIHYFARVSKIQFHNSSSFLDEKLQKGFVILIITVTVMATINILAPDAKLRSANRI